MEMNQFYLNALSTHGIAIPGAAEFLQMVEDGCTLAIASNGVAKTQHGRIAESGLAPFFDECFISEEVGAPKPAKKFFAAAMSTLGITRPEKVLMVGDNLQADIGGAAKFGLATCWFNPKGLPNDTDIKPTHEVSDYEQLARLVMGEEEWLCRSEKKN